LPKSIEKAIDPNEPPVLLLSTVKLSLVRAAPAPSTTTDLVFVVVALAQS
jgi:hypothetical protein